MKIRGQGAWLSKCCDMHYPNGQKFRILATYVDFERRIALKIDEINNVVVTFVDQSDERKET